MDRGLTERERILFRRNLLIEDMGEAGQLALLGSRVLLVGLGGLGSPALLYLTAAGVGSIGIMDMDRVDLSNLQRQVLYGEGDLGSDKTSRARARAMQIRSDAEVQVHQGRISEANARQIIAGYDFVIEATDNRESKFVVNDACVALNIAFSHAGVRELQGQTMTVLPGRGPCVRCVFGDVPDLEAGREGEERGILGPVAGVVGAIQALEAIKYLVGFGELLVGRLLTWDAGRMEFRRVPLPAEPSCGVCGKLLDGAEYEKRGFRNQ